MGPDNRLLDLWKVILKVIRGEPPHFVAVDLASSEYFRKPAIHFGNSQPILKPSMLLGNLRTLTMFAQQTRCGPPPVQISRTAAMRCVPEYRVQLAPERL